MTNRYSSSIVLIKLKALISIDKSSRSNHQTQTKFSKISKLMSIVADNLRQIQKKIQDLQPIQKVCLVAVSKTKPIEDLMVCYDAGQRHFGENVSLLAYCSICRNWWRRKRNCQKTSNGISLDLCSQTNSSSWLH